MELLNIDRPAYSHYLEPMAERPPFRSRAWPERDGSRARPPVYTLPAGANAFALPAQLLEPATMAANEDALEVPVDKDALFRGLVKEYGASLYYFILKRVRHPDDAADLAQQAFVEAACSLTSYRAEAELSTWIFGIATNLARNHISRAPQHRHRFESDDVLQACESAELQPCESLSQRQGLALVSEAMNAMPREMARALNLVVIEELSYEEAAAELDVPVGTVRSRVSRARAAVRTHMRNAGYLGA